MGPERLSVRDSRSRTNNVLESYHASLRRRIKVAHPNLFTFLSTLSKATVDYMTDVTRLDNGLNIRRPKKKANIMNEERIQTCISKFDSGLYSRLQFLRAVSHSLGAHTDALHVSQDSEEDETGPETESNGATQNSGESSVGSTNDMQVEDLCEVCLLSPRAGVALVPCGHSRFCATCAETVATMGSGCPICRSHIDMVLRLFN